MNEIKKSGYASIDQPWMKQYSQAKELNDADINTTVWNAIEKSLEKYANINLIEYFGKNISREEFAKYVETWARTFRALGVQKGENVPLYVPATPESYAMFLALNAIGAIPNFIKLSITKEALERETIDSRIAVVFDMLWPNVSSVFSGDKFKNVVVTSSADSMMFPLKQITKMQSYFQNKKNSNGIPKDKKYIWTDDAIKIAKFYTGEYKEEYTPNQVAIITSSSGTTSHNVKGVMNTNEGILASLNTFANAETGYGEGKRVLTCFPPTASTSINTLQLVPTLVGGTIIFDPRVDMSLWYKQLMKYKPAITVSTGAVWEKFVDEIILKEKNGKKHDLSWIDFFILGGSGANPEIFNKINTVLKDRGAKGDMNVGYGLSEVFGPLTLTKYDSVYSSSKELRPVINVGIPLPGYIVGIFDEAGNEIPYGKGYRGELWVKSPANMAGYYNQENLTNKIFTNGWIKSGDLCEIDENGNVYFYGRLKNSFTIDNQKKFLFDIANELRQVFKLHDINVEKKDLIDNKTALVIYFVQENNRHLCSLELMRRMDKYLAEKNIVVSGYKEFDGAIPIDPTTLKTRTKDTDGFIKFVDHEEYDVSYEEVSMDLYEEKIIKKNNKVLKR